MQQIWDENTIDHPSEEEFVVADEVPVPQVGQTQNGDEMMKEREPPVPKSAIVRPVCRLGFGLARKRDEEDGAVPGLGKKVVRIPKSAGPCKAGVSGTKPGKPAASSAGTKPRKSSALSSNPFHPLSGHTSEHASPFLHNPQNSDSEEIRIMSLIQKQMQ